MPTVCAAVVLKVARAGSVPHSNHAVVSRPLGMAFPCRVTPAGEIDATASVETAGAAPGWAAGSSDRMTMRSTPTFRWTGKLSVAHGEVDHAEFTRKRENGTYLSFPEMNGRGNHRTEAEPVPVVTTAPVRKGNGEKEVLLPDKATLKEVSKIAQRNAERDLIDRVLRQTRWNRRKAAQILDISYKALLYKIKECGLNQD